MREIVEHDGPRRGNVVRLEKAVKGFARRLGGDVFERVDVENVLEAVEQAKLGRHGFSVLSRTVGEHEFPPRQLIDGRSQRRCGRHNLEIDVVHIIEKGVRRDAVKLHETGKRGAVLGVVALPQRMRLVERKIEGVGDERAHALVHLREQVAVRRIERVVEIEHPSLDMAETVDMAKAARRRGVRHRGALVRLPLGRRRSISVPAPCSVKSSSSTACGTLPLIITTASTPSAITSTQPSIFGIMPPVMVPSSISVCASPVVMERISRPSLSSTPSTSVSSRSRFALSATASAAANVSALIFRVSPSGPTPIGATTGIRSDWMMTSMIWGSTSPGSPTNPRSSTCSILESGSRTRRSSRLARIKLASLPQMPTALPPWLLMADTISLLTEPASTISTTSTVSRSVTRKPPLNSDLILSRSSSLPICGPPPCTTTGFTPACLSRTMSRAKSRASSGSPMACPPYFTTTVLRS